MCGNPVNSENAQKLKTAWTPLVYAQAAFLAMENSLLTVRFNFLGIGNHKPPTQPGIESRFVPDDMNERYCRCRDKVAEIIALRALTRPETADEGRAEFITAAKKVVKGLGATLPSKVGLMLQ